MTDYPQIIGLNGVARAGKDTVAQILHDLYGYNRVAFADRLRAVVHDSNARVDLAGESVDIGAFVDDVGWEQAKEHMDVRALLQGVGVAAREHLYTDVWVDAAFATAPAGPIVISDMRFPNEYEKIRSLGGVTWQIERPNTQPALNHISDTALRGFDFDAVIQNDGSIRDLADKVIALLDPLQAAHR